MFNKTAKSTALSVCLWLALAAVSAPLQSSEQSASPATNQGSGRTRAIELISDADEYIERFRQAVENAHRGVYGSIRRQDMKRLDESLSSIEKLLANHEGEPTLSHDQQIELVNAQESINAIIRSDDKDRIICKKLPITGSRLAKTECLSVAERERQAEYARETVRTVNEYCVPGAGNSCTK